MCFSWFDASLGPRKLYFLAIENIKRLLVQEYKNSQQTDSKQCFAVTAVFNSQVKAEIDKGFIRGKNRAQTYLSSAVWAAMRVRRLLSARGQPEETEEQ